MRAASSAALTRRRIVTTTVAVAFGVALLIAGPPAAGDPVGSCWTHPEGTVTDGENQPVDDADAGRADIVEYCLDFTDDHARFALRVADPVDPRGDPNWAGERSQLAWDVTTTGEQLDGEFVDASAEALYVVRYFRAGLDLDQVRTTLAQPEGGGYVCDGAATYDDGWLVSEFRVADDSACFADDTQVAVAPTVVYDVDPDGEADSPRFRLDRAPEEDAPGQDGYRGFVTREGDTGDEPPPTDRTTACEGQPVPASGFDDIAGNTHEDAIECIVWHGLTRGAEPDRYGPSGRVTRAQMASFIARTMTTADFELPAASDQGFADVAGNTHEDAINQLAAAGVVQGTSARTYSPGLPVSRAQMASFLVRAYQTMEGPLPEGSSGFTDTVGNTHEHNIDKAAEAGFAAGTTSTTYSPTNPVRRDQMGAFLARVLERLAVDGRVTPPADVPDDALVLRPDGYGPFDLGDPADDVVADARSRLGPPTSDGSAQCPSGSDRVVSWEALTLVFHEGLWRGYSVAEGQPAATRAGVEVGDSVAELQAAYPNVELAERTLGPEWSVDFGGDSSAWPTTLLTGLLTGLEADDAVVTISAGDNCAFR